MLSRIFKRSYLSLSPTIHEAISTSKPIVALESTIITHGLPYPINFEMARQVEEIIREEGAVPATMAFLNGTGHVGLSAQQLKQLATADDMVKISRRDIPNVVATGKSGGTTIAATMIMANQVGIKVFGTGGLGGVHRGVEETWDISADLEELGRTPVAVVCSGPKSILDIPKTLEYLETKGVPVYTQGPPGVQVPGFFTRASGSVSPFNFETPLEAAKQIAALNKFGLGMGSVWCVPCPEHLAMDPALVNGAIELALAEAEANGITGKETTPYLLKKVWEFTKGDTVQVNTEFVKNNARTAARIARELAGLSSGAAASVQVPEFTPFKEPTPEKGFSKAKVVVVGSLAQDLTCTLATDNISVSSYPGQISTTVGGVAHNVALASTYTGVSTRLVSVVGEKEQPAISASLSTQLDQSGISSSATARTARYVSMNDSKGGLIVACADMETIEKMDIKHIRNEIERSDPNLIVFDGNIGRQQVTEILQVPEIPKIFEPTSIPKSAHIANQNLSVYPNNQITLSTPNSLELMSMYEEFSYREKFDVHNWFPVIDALPMDQPATQMKLQYFISRAPEALGDIVQSGLVQAAVQLLPYIPNLFIKLGKNGVLSVQLIEYLKDRTADLSGTNSVYAVNLKKPYGMLMQHFPIPETVPEDQVKSVNGIGDTFCGVIAAELAKSKDWLRDDGADKAAVISRAQTAAALSLQTYQPVSSKIAELF